MLLKTTLQELQVVIDIYNREIEGEKLMLLSSTQVRVSDRKQKQLEVKS